MTGQEFWGRYRGKVWEVAKTITLAVALAMVVRIGVAQAYVVEGPSMEPTLQDGDRLLVARSVYGLSIPGRSKAVVSWALPYPGDVVILESPADEVDLVKRVVGLPGDTIEIRQGRVYRNGEALPVSRPYPCDDSRYLHPEQCCRVFNENSGSHSYRTSRCLDGMNQDRSVVRVPPGDVYVLGDHRDRSNDSRSFGPVPSNRLRGKVLFVD